MNGLLSQDSGFRTLFGLLGVKPFFVTTDELSSNPRGVVGAIADDMKLPVNENEPGAALEWSAPYGRRHLKQTAGLTEHFKRMVFG